MAHMIDTSNARNNMAYVGQTPWHGLGQKLTAGRSIEEWTDEAGLAFDVRRSVVEYQRDGVAHNYGDRHVLYRSDTGAPLSVVSKDYKIVQPAEVMEFFRDLVKAGNFELETAGSLAGGKRIWALARVNDGANIIGQDLVRPYLLLATSFDASLSTTAKFTAVRVVCHNTLTMSAGNEGAGQNEVDKTHGAVVNAIRVSHSDKFDSQAVRSRLGIALNAWDEFLIRSRITAEKELTRKQVEELTYDLIEPTVAAKPGQPKPDIRTTRGYKRLMELFDGKAIGHNLVGGPTAWAWTNCVTQWVDHERGRTRDTGLDSAWFGQGNTLKSRAFEMAVAA